MRYFRTAERSSALEEWTVPPNRVMAVSESQDAFGQCDRAPGFTIWSGKPGRLAWPLSLSVIMALSVGLWAAIISPFVI
jgi:hypothetical protein